MSRLTKTPLEVASMLTQSSDAADLAAIAAEWEAFSLEWAERLIAIAESTSAHAAREAAWEVADRACREARGEQPDAGPLPGWFSTRVSRVIGRYGFAHFHPRWVDHEGVVKAPVPYQAKPVRCFVTEPYLWAKWNKITRSPEMLEAKQVAAATGCKLVVHRVAWWNAECFRMTFVPYDHRLTIKEAAKVYSLQPLVT